MPKKNITILRATPLFLSILELISYNLFPLLLMVLIGGYFLWLVAKFSLIIYFFRGCHKT
ncbi:MAG: hypothetical protein PHY08_08455 [Candidatus Cloacimonetes bacterium]|nr:hypothetical protein [Candidatus Cloacimonadota bacterium]